MNWPLVKLGECCDVISGYAFKSSLFGDEGIPIARIRDVVRGYSETKYQGEYKEEYVLKNGDMLVGMDGDFNLAKWKGGKALLNQRVCKIVCETERLDQQYCYYFLPIALKEIWEETPFVTVKHLSVKQIRDIQIPLPPLPIQKQIAAVLEKADILRQQSQQMEQELNQLAQSVFLEMFGDPVENPKGWERATLSSLLSGLLGGKSIAASENQEGIGSNRVLKISAVTSGEFRPEESKPLPQEYTPPKEHFVQKNDLLISRANTTELVGATTLVFNTPDNLLLPDKLWRFEWKNPNKVSQIFMWKLLSSSSMRTELSKISSGSGGSMKNISKSKLLGLEVILPEYEQQMRYEKAYLQIRARFQNNHALKVESENLFDSLMQRAFTGELNLNSQ